MAEESIDCGDLFDGDEKEKNPRLQPAKLFIKVLTAGSDCEDNGRAVTEGIEFVGLDVIVA